MGSENETPAPIRLNVKLARPSIRENAEKLLSGTPGLKSVVQTFPDEADDELSRHFTVEVEPTAVASALENLQKNPAIEYAEPSARRKLIR
jgi:hypothetical protein